MNNKFQLVIGEKVSGLLIGAVTNFGGSEGTSPLPSDSTIDTSGSSPGSLLITLTAYVHSQVSVGFKSIECVCLLFYDKYSRYVNVGREHELFKKIFLKLTIVLQE